MTAALAARLLAVIADASHKSETVLIRQFPMAGKALAVLMRDGLLAYHNDACTAVHITAAGRSALRRLREADRAGRAA